MKISNEKLLNILSKPGQVELEKYNLEMADLSQDYLTSQPQISQDALVGANFAEANLCKANLAGTQLLFTDFFRANLSEADFELG